MATINAQANLLTEGGTRQAEEIEAWKAKHKYLRVNALARVNDLKSKLATSEADLSRYYAFTGFNLRQESEPTQDLKAWVVFQQSQRWCYSQVASALSLQSGELSRKMIVFHQELDQTDALKAWAKSLEAHLHYCSQVALRWGSQHGELRDITEKMIAYSQRSDSKEAIEKMQGMNLQRDLTKVGYWPIDPSHGTTEASPAAGSTFAKNVVDNPVQETTPAASKTSEQIVKADKPQPPKLIVPPFDDPVSERSFPPSTKRAPTTAAQVVAPAEESWTQELLRLNESSSEEEVDAAELERREAFRRKIKRAREEMKIPAEPEPTSRPPEKSSASRPDKKPPTAGLDQCKPSGEDEASPLTSPIPPISPMDKTLTPVKIAERKPSEREELAGVSSPPLAVSGLDRVQHHVDAHLGTADTELNRGDPVLLQLLAESDSSDSEPPINPKLKEAIEACTRRSEWESEMGIVCQSFEHLHTTPPT